jgi:formylglycine-generating enzyme
MSLKRSIPTLSLAIISVGVLVYWKPTPEAETQTARERCKIDALDQTVALIGGSFVMGINPQYPEEGPEQEVYVDDFRIDAHEVTNKQFAEFVKATGYITDAEKMPPSTMPQSQELPQAGSAVFHEPDAQNPKWWRWIGGANWNHPLGPHSTISGKENHPVVHVSYNDAEAYAVWKGGQLPSEAQWEYAARGGDNTPEPPLNAAGTIEANTYQDAFPVKDTGADGFVGTSPVGCFGANGYGLYDMIGNVWEWTKADGMSKKKRTATIKGGSFLCAENFCRRYRPSARQFQERDLGTNHIGFRLVYPINNP